VTDGSTANATGSNQKESHLKDLFEIETGYSSIEPVQRKLITRKF
jgi:hypothetical protein